MGVLLAIHTFSSARPRAPCLAGFGFALGFAFAFGLAFPPTGRQLPLQLQPQHKLKSTDPQAVPWSVNTAWVHDPWSQRSTHDCAGDAHGSRPIPSGPRVFRHSPAVWVWTPLPLPSSAPTVSCQMSRFPAFITFLSWVFPRTVICGPTLAAGLVLREATPRAPRGGVCSKLVAR